jgi:hypothetical protein
MLRECLIRLWCKCVMAAVPVLDLLERMIHLLSFNAAHAAFYYTCLHWKNTTFTSEIPYSPFGVFLFG